MEINKNGTPSTKLAGEIKKAGRISLGLSNEKDWIAERVLHHGVILDDVIFYANMIASHFIYMSENLESIKKMYSKDDDEYHSGEFLRTYLELGMNVDFPEDESRDFNPFESLDGTVKSIESALYSFENQGYASAKVTKRYLSEKVNFYFELLKDGRGLIRKIIKSPT
jgi:hypothetical protein